MNKWKRGIAIAGLLLIALFFLPFLVPTSAYIGQAEGFASEKLGVPVEIGNVQLAILPTPRVNINNIVIGQKQELKVVRVAVLPSLTSLFSDTKVISSLHIEQPVLKKAAVDVVAGIIKKLSEDKSPSTAIVREITIKETRLEWPGMNLPAFNAVVAMSEASKPQSALIDTTDGKLRLRLAPSDKDWQAIKLEAKNWTMPVGQSLLIDEMQANMKLYDNRLEITDLNAGLYGGRVNGKAVLNWDKDWRLSGSLKVNELAVREPARLFSKTTRVSGLLFTNGSFSAKAKEAGHLMEHVNAGFRFKIKDGVLYGMDLTKAATILLKQGQSGGETQFDELSGLLNVSGKQYHFSDLNIVSGLMAANGDVKIRPNKELDGVVEVEVKRGVALAGIPLQVSGTVDNPQLFPTKAAMAGAVVGTAVLGPGVGTGLGIKAGSAMEKLKGLFSTDKN